MKWSWIGVWSGRVFCSYSKTIWRSNAYWYFTIAFIILSAILQKTSFRIAIKIPENSSLKDTRWVSLPSEFAAFNVFLVVFYTVRNTHSMLILLHTCNGETVKGLKSDFVLSDTVTKSQP